MILFTVFTVLIMLLYVASFASSMAYFLETKKYKDLRLIFFVATFCPVWNTYFAIKNMKECNLIPSGKEICGWVANS